MDRLRLLEERAVRGALGLALGREIEYHSRIGSTQDRARALCDAGVRAVVVAEEQTAGRGRRGHAWLAPAGSALLASWTFRPLPADPALFGLLAGVAVARALASLGVTEARLKWPNDVQLGGRKLAGTLADAVTDDRGGAVVLGIGVNVGQSRDQLADVGQPATSLAAEGHEIDRLALLAHVTAELDRLAGDAAERPPALEEWRARSSVLGREVEVRGAGGAEAVRGLALELADDGALVIRTPYGAQRIFAGEVSLV